MQNLDLEWEDPLFRYAQVERTAKLAIYTQTHKRSGTVRYEAIKIRHHTAHTWPNGDFTPAGERYPSSKEWGNCGWTFFTLAAAQEKIRELDTTPKS